MSWRDEYLTKSIQAFRDHVAELDEAERRAKRDTPSGVKPARKGVPEGPGQRAARLLAKQDHDSTEAHGDGSS